MGPKKEAGKGRAFESKSKSEVAGGAKCKPGESSAKKGSKNCAEEKAAVKKGNSKKGGKREAEDPAAKAAREAEEERALYPPSEDEDDAYCAQEEEEEEEEDETTSTAPVARTTDKFGNSVAGGECAKNAALERARCEARQRREAKAAAAAAATCARGEGDDAADRVVAPGGGCGSEKAATGKLSNKAKKLLKKEQERAARLARCPAYMFRLRTSGGQGGPRAGRPPPKFPFPPKKKKGKPRRGGALLAGAGSGSGPRRARVVLALALEQLERVCGRGRGLGQRPAPERRRHRGLLHLGAGATLARDGAPRGRAARVLFFLFWASQRSCCPLARRRSTRTLS